MQWHSKQWKHLTWKQIISWNFEKNVKTINLFCGGNNVFVNFRLKGGLTPLYDDVEAWIVIDECFDINILFTEADDTFNRNVTFSLTEQAHLFD